MFAMELPQNVCTLLAVLRANGYHGYVVGGCVRDAYMGKQPHDYDMTTDAKPEEILRCFSAYRTIETGIRHGTVTVLAEHEPFEITTFRIDGEYADHRHPSGVTFTVDLAEDLARRDFTVNAMAHDGQELTDLFGGIEDIERRCIRCVGEPDRRFREDGLRILRALRFASVLDFSVYAQTSDALRRKKTLLREISVERLYTELNKLIVGKRAQAVLTEYADVFRVFMPGFSETGAALIDLVPPDRIMRLSMLADRETLLHLRADKKTVQAVAQLQEEPLTDARHLLARMEQAQAHRLVNRAFAFGTIGEADKERLHTEIRQTVLQKECVSLKDLAVHGTDLQAMGIQGAEVGKRLHDLLEQVLCGTLPNDREKLLEAVRCPKNESCIP